MIDPRLESYDESHKNQGAESLMDSFGLLEFFIVSCIFMNTDDTL